MKPITLTGLVQAIRWHRTGIAMLALFVAVLCGLLAIAPGQTPGTPLVVAAHVLPPGTPLSADDLTTITVPPEAVPDGAYAITDDLLGRPLSVGVTRGTPITSAVLTADALTNHATNEVLVPFRVHDPDVASLLRVGDQLTVVTSTPEGLMQTVAEHIRVAQLPSSTSGGLLSSGTTGGALIVMAAPREMARQLAAVSDQWLGVIIE